MKTAVQILNCLTDLKDVKVSIEHGQYYYADNEWGVQLILDTSEIKVEVNVKATTFELAVVEAWEKFEKSISKGLGPEKLQPLQLSSPSPSPDDYAAARGVISTYSLRD